MERTNVMYVTEEEKLAILRNRLEAERKANRRRLTEHERNHRILGVILLILAIGCFIIGGELIIGSIMGIFFSIVCFAAREEDRKEWIKQ